jgi:hypothetical protein
MSLWEKYKGRANPTGAQPDVGSSSSSSSRALGTDTKQERPDTSQLDAAETGQGVFRECHLSTRPETTGSRIPGPVGGHRERPSTHMPAKPNQEHLMSGALPTPPDSGSRATAADWAAEVSRGLRQTATKTSMSPNDEADPRSTNETPEWLTPRPAPGGYALEDQAAATQRFLYGEQARSLRPTALASNNPYREPKLYSRARRSHEGGRQRHSRSASNRRSSGSSRTSRFREALDRIDEHGASPPPLPSRHPARTSLDGSEKYASSASSPAVSSQVALVSAATIDPTDTMLHNPFDDEHAVSSPTTGVTRPPAIARLPSSFGQAARMPAHLQRDPTPPDGQGARIARVEYAAGGETEAEIKRRTLRAIQEELRVAGETVNEKLARTDRVAVVAVQQDNSEVGRPAPLPSYTWLQVTALAAVLAGVSVYSLLSLSRHKTGMAYVNWHPHLNNATLKALDFDGDGGKGITSFRASTPDNAEMYALTRDTVALDDRQREDMCVYNAMPTFNLTSSRLISGMANLTPRGAGFPAVGVPSFGNVVAFCVMVCGVYTLIWETLRRVFRKREVRRWEKGSVSALGRILDSFLAWGEVVGVLLSSVFTALVISGIVTAVFRSKVDM